MSGIQLHYPDLSYYWLTYGTPENPNAGKEFLVEAVQHQSGWDPWTSTPSNSDSLGVFQFLPSSWESV